MTPDSPPVTARPALPLPTLLLPTLLLPTLLLAALLLAAGCATLPDAGPSARAFDDNTLSRPTATGEGFAVVDLDSRVLDLLENRPRPSLRATFRDRRGDGGHAVGRGDRLNVTIWEAGSGGLFTGTGEAGSAGSRATALPAQDVDRNGTIAVPYGGRIEVAGLSLAEVEARIVRALAGKAIEPQAIVTLERNLTNAVTVSGDAIAGARIALSPRGERILDAIAMAGGTRSPIHETRITMTRDGRALTLPMQALIENPSENIPLRAGDAITLVRMPDRFSALGAAGKNALIDFGAPRLTLDKAVARAGGLVGPQSDPAGVFVLRREPLAFARRLAPQFTPAAGARRVNVVYRVNLRDPNGLFLSQRFELRPDDILYVAGAPANEWTRFLNVIGLTGATLKAARTF